MTAVSTIITAGFIMYVHGAESHSTIWTIAGVLLMSFGIASGIRIENKLTDRIEKLEEKGKVK